MTVQVASSATAMTVGAVAAAGATHLAVDLVGGGFGALLPTITEQLELSSTGAGMLVALFSVTALGSQPLMGGLADRFDSRHVTAIAAVVAAAVLAAAAVVTSVPALLFVILVGGLASAAFHPSGAILARRLGPGAPENSVAVLDAAGTIGLALGPIAAVARSDGARWWDLLLAVPALLVTPLIWWGSRALTPDEFVPRERRPASRILLRGEVSKLVAAATLVVIASTSIASTLPLWIADEPGRGATDPAIGWALATFSLSAAAGGVAGGRLAHRSARLDSSACRCLPQCSLQVPSRSQPPQLPRRWRRSCSRASSSDQRSHCCSSPHRTRHPSAPRQPQARSWGSRTDWPA